MGVIDMVNGKLCETLPVEEIEQIRNEGYQQGRADYAKEISANFDDMDRTAYRMGRADGIMQGRADAIDEFENWLHKRILRTIPIEYDELVKVLEQMKERSNE